MPIKRTARLSVAWRAIRPFDEFPDFFFPFFSLDFNFESNFLEALVLVAELVKILSTPVEPAAHLFF